MKGSFDYAPFGTVLVRYSKILIDGTPTFFGQVTDLLTEIARNTEGGRLLAEMQSKAHSVTIKDAGPGKGNSTSYSSDHAFPLMVQAIKKNNADLFRSSLGAALTKAKSRGITLEHLARQFAMGLTPARYAGVATNAVRPTTKVGFAPTATPQQVFHKMNNEIMNSMGFIQDLVDGRRTLAHIPVDARHEYPRVFRDYLQPGRGSDCTVKCNPTDTKPCALDPAMKNRPPALGLAHELIHALHGMTGTNMRVSTDGQYNASGAPMERLEEVITTGVPPYTFEPFSDNKLRALWDVKVELRKKY